MGAALLVFELLAITHLAGCGLQDGSSASKIGQTDSVPESRRTIAILMLSLPGSVILSRFKLNMHCQRRFCTRSGGANYKLQQSAVTPAAWSRTRRKTSS